MLSTAATSQTTVAPPSTGSRLLCWLSRRIGKTEKLLPGDTTARRAGSLRVIGHGRSWQERICVAVPEEIQQVSSQKVILIMDLSGHTLMRM
jgi:hypothetical protein